MRTVIIALQNKTDTRKEGFSLPELMVAISISSIVMIAVLSTFIWCGKQAIVCTKSGWSQGEALSTAERVSQYIRNSSKIIDIDEEEGTWVTLQQVDGSTGTLVYSNAPSLLRDGKMFLFIGGGAEKIVARGLTEIQSNSGFSTPVFQQTDVNAVRVAYRVSEPNKAGGRDADDGLYAAHVRFGVCLRNYTFE